MTVHTQPDYQIRTSDPAPADYPSAPMPDSFSDQPFLPDYEFRRRAFFEHILRNPAPANTKPAWHELARLAGRRDSARRRLPCCAGFHRRAQGLFRFCVAWDFEITRAVSSRMRY